MVLSVMIKQDNVFVFLELKAECVTSKILLFLVEISFVKKLKITHYEFQLNGDDF